MAINKRYTHLNLTGSNHSQLDAEFAYITGTLGVGGVATFNAGLSGSLTRLVDGSSYLAAGPNIIITSASNGQVTIEATTSGGSSPEYWTSDVANAIWTSGSVLARGGDTTTAASDYGTDTFFFVSGAIDGVTDGNGVAAFGGDVVVSGNLIISGVNSAAYPSGLIVNGTATVYRSLNVGSDAADIASFQSQLTASAGIDTPTIGSFAAVTVISPLTASVGLEITGNSAFAAGSTFTFNGDGVFAAGLSGSLQRLSDGTSYLVAGPNITITSASSGQVTIEATAAAAINYWDSASSGSIYTTGSVALVGNDFATKNEATDYGTDVFFFVSGNIGGVGSAGVTAFGGDVVMSGNLNVAGTATVADLLAITQNLEVGGTLAVTGSSEFLGGLSGSLTHLTDGSSYLIAGANITITSASNGAITIAATDTAGPSYWSETALEVIQTSGSVDISGQGSAVGTIRQGGRNKLRVGGLDMTPITGTAATSDPAYVGGNVSVVVSGSILSASYGVWNPAQDDDHVLQHHISIVAGGQSNTDFSKNYFAANYAVTSKIAYSTGVQTVIAATEITRDAIGPYAQNWDVNFNDNCDVTVTGTLGPTGVIVQWHVQRTKEMSIGFGYGVIT